MSAGGASQGSEGGAPLPTFQGSDGGATPTQPDTGSPVACDVVANTGSLTDGDVNIDVAAELQRVTGFGGMDGGFYPELTPEQVDTAFGNGPGQLGLSIIRIRIPETADRFGTSAAAAARAAGLGATVMATPWSPPAALKSNNSTVAGSLNVASYGAYGLLTEDGVVSKRGYTMAQYSKFVRPGYVRVEASQPAIANLSVTAYKGGEQLVVVALNQTDQAQAIDLDVHNGCATSFSRFTTSATKNLQDDGPVALTGGRATVTLEPQSITTFVSP